MSTNPSDRALALLRSWSNWSERYWSDVRGRAGEGFFGTGYDGWGVQTNQKYLSAMAVLGAGEASATSSPTPSNAIARAVAALRFSLASHLSGGGACSDGTRWGHTWISALGVERMMHGVRALDVGGHLSGDDRADVRRMLSSEAGWLLRDYRRGKHAGVQADRWAETGRNDPESNIWNGALLWRAAASYPDDADAPAWRERALSFLANGVSVPADASDDTPFDGSPLRDRHVGASFFPNYALDHHGYLNVGYMVICASNAAMLHFDLRAAGQPAPELLHLHQADLWRVIRKMIFADGRLARIGGDSRVRYAYCQEYLLPALLYAADHLGDDHAGALVGRQLDLIEHEAKANGDGSFYGKRLAELARRSPYYYTRLESDRACALGMVVAYGRLVGNDGVALQDVEGGSTARTAGGPPVRVSGGKRAGRPWYEESDVAGLGAFESSVEGSWCEPEHGAVLHRCPTRLASFSWRAYGLAQGTCQPPGDGALAEWDGNLAGGATVLHRPPSGALSAHRRRLLWHDVRPFDGGFVTSGAIVEGADVELAEGWRGADSAVHHIAFVALPDGHTVVGLQRCRAADRRVYFERVVGMQMNVPNDLFNGFVRALATDRGTTELRSPAPADETVGLASAWACVDDKVGAVLIYGADGLSLRRSARRRGGVHGSLFVDELCAGCRDGPFFAEANETVLDVGWLALSGLPATEVARVRATESPVRRLDDDLRGVTVTAVDGRRYLVLANFGDRPHVVTAPGGSWSDVVTGKPVTGEPPLEAGRATVWVAAR